MDKKIIWKLNLIDLIIIALIILSIFALAYKVFWDSGNDVQNFEMICVCEEAPSELLYAIPAGSICINSVSGTDIGKIVKTDIETVEENSDKAKAVISILVDGTKNDHGISIDDTVYLKGSEFSIIIEDSIFDVYISDIR